MPNRFWSFVVVSRGHHCLPCMMSLPDNVQRAVTVLGCGEEAELEARDLRRMFKRRMLAQLPERHPSLASAHSKFEEILAAFVEVSPVRDESCQWSLRPLLVLSQLRIYEDTLCSLIFHDHLSKF